MLVRGFDHESEMSPYATDDDRVWPGVIDEVPTALRPLLDDPTFVDGGHGAPRRGTAGPAGGAARGRAQGDGASNPCRARSRAARSSGTAPPLA